MNGEGDLEGWAFWARDRFFTGFLNASFSGVSANLHLGHGFKCFGCSPRNGREDDPSSQGDVTVKLGYQLTLFTDGTI